MSNNPYNPPQAEVASNHRSKTYQPKLFSFSGRIGRMRYLAYSLIAFPIMMVLMGIMSLTGSFSSSSAEPPFFLMGVFGIIAMAIALVFAKRRFNDLGHSGWFSIATLVPYLNLLIYLYLVFGKGKEAENQYGLAPCPNPLIVKILAWCCLLIPILGIIAAIALPAYQDYAIRASQ